jgi:hypothetical protein
MSRSQHVPIALAACLSASSSQCCLFTRSLLTKNPSTSVMTVDHELFQPPLRRNDEYPVRGYAGSDVTKMQKVSIKCRSPRHLADRVPKRSTIPSRRLLLARLCDRRARPKKREERRWQRRRSKPGRNLGTGIEGSARSCYEKCFPELKMLSGAKAFDS